jgi:Zn-dependent protease with chaperone function
MITLDHNKLRFSVPEITRELARLANTEADKLAAKFLGENRAFAFERLQKDNYKFGGLSVEYKRSKRTLTKLQIVVRNSRIKCANGSSLL